jgi:hypothetical protein
MRSKGRYLKAPRRRYLDVLRRDAAWMPCAEALLGYVAPTRCLDTLRGGAAWMSCAEGLVRCLAQMMLGCPAQAPLECLAEAPLE